MMLKSGLVLATSVSLGLSVAPFRDPVGVPALPRCWGVVHEGPGGYMVLTCQNPCLVGGGGCNHWQGTVPGTNILGITCKCPDALGAPCCDIWLLTGPGGDSVAGGDCGGSCPGSGACTKYEDEDGAYGLCM